MDERFKSHAWKACVGLNLPRVRIPPLPQIVSINAGFKKVFPQTHLKTHTKAIVDSVAFFCPSERSVEHENVPKTARMKTSPAVNTPLTSQMVDVNYMARDQFSQFDTPPCLEQVPLCDLLKLYVPSLQAAEAPDGCLPVLLCAGEWTERPALLV